VSANIIDQVISDFYELAKKDILIGYHFRHIKDFDSHIPKIQRFWYLILQELTPSQRKDVIKKGIPKNVIHSHEYLKIKKGEVGRWVLLFNQILKKHEKSAPELILKWRDEIKKFEKIFLNAKALYA
jgi:hypothetical protein